MLFVSNNREVFQISKKPRPRQNNEKPELEGGGKVYVSEAHRKSA